MKRFLLLTLPRTGSTMVADWLDSHPDLTCYLGLFGRHEFRGEHHATTGALRQRLDDRWEDWAERKANCQAFAADVAANTPPCAAMGFKFHLNGPPEVAEWVVDTPGHILIHLTRPNRLATWSSAELARQFGRNNATDANAEPQPKIDFDAAMFERHIAQRDRHDALWRPRVQAKGGFESSYTRARTREGIDDLYRFLGVDPQLGGRPGVSKTNTENLLERFTNADDVLAWLEAHDRLGWLEPEL